MLDLAETIPVQVSAGVFKRSTEAQRETLYYKIERYWHGPDQGRRVKQVCAHMGTMGLSDAYMGVVFEFEDGGQLVGGIDPEGRMST